MFSRTSEPGFLAASSLVAAIKKDCHNFKVKLSLLLIDELLQLQQSGEQFHVAKRYMKARIGHFSIILVPKNSDIQADTETSTSAAAAATPPSIRSLSSPTFFYKSSNTLANIDSYNLELLVADISGGNQFGAPWTAEMHVAANSYKAVERLLSIFEISTIYVSPTSTEKLQQFMELYKSAEIKNTLSTDSVVKKFFHNDSKAPLAMAEHKIFKSVMKSYKESIVKLLAETNNNKLRI